MRNQLSQLLALGPELTALILTAPLLLAQPASALPYTTVPSPNLDLGSLGRVALAGDYDSISIYQYVGQNEHAVNSNGSQGLLTRYPNGDFQSLDMTDAYIQTMCPFVKDGQLQGVVVGGNFTSLGGVQAQGIALWNPDTQDVTALPGLSGQVKALYCDDDSGTVYVGGSFVGGNSSNAMAWTTGWTNLPFAGFNGPVSSIAKNDGKIVFGGSFSGLGNTTTPTEPDIQVVNLSSGKITGEGSTSRSEFSDPSKIVCNANTSEDSNTWLLQDGIPGFWQGDYGFGFNPTKLRLYNTEQEGRGTKTFYFENMNSGGILEMQYYDADGNNQTCSARCPLAHNATGQDFHFDPPVGMNSFRIRIVDWYGSGGGLSGIELYQDQIFAFAVSDFNEPSCKAGQQVSESSHTPDNNDFWIQKPNNGQTSSDYLSAFLTDSDQFNDDISVTFKPNIRQSGNYSVTVYTPGCIQDNTCITRGHVNLTASMTSDGEPISTTFFQTNNYDKFDQIYYGYIDAEADGFRPSVTLTPVSNQSIPLTVVAQRVRFELVNSTSGLNGLFEYDPNQAEVNTDFASNPINAAGSKLHDRAVVHAVATVGGDTFVAGNFNGSGISNVMKVGDNATALPNGGLNDEVQCMFQNGSTLYMGGNFSNTAEKSVEGLNSIAVFSAADNTWTALGAGVDGPVFSIVPVTLNVTSGVNETCLAVSGAFASVNAFGDNKSYNTSGIAVWVLSAGNWLHNIQDAAISVDGLLTSYTYVDGFGPLFGGSFSSQPVGLSGACELEDSGNALQSMGIKIQPPSSTTSNLNKRALNIDSSSNATGVYNGLFYGDNGLNITILGGSFAAEGSDGSTAENLVFINNTASEQTIRGVNGLDSSSIFVAMDTIDELLFVGGAVTGANGDAEVNGLVVIDLQTGDFASSQPPALSGDVVVVNAVATQPDSSIIYVGGDFDRAGGLSCRTMCYYDTEAQQWNTPGSGLSGTINSMIWISNDDLVIAGNLTIQGNSTTMATYNAKNAEYSTFEGAFGLPGPIMALGAGDREYETWWAAGNNPESNVGYLSKFERHSWSAVSDLGEGTTVRGLQVLYVTDNHDDNELVPKDQLLMLSGNINTASAGNASVALFNGTTIAPFILASKSDGTPATMSQMFVSKPANLLRGADNHHLALGLVVLIGLAIALALTFMLVVAGILLERFRRRREGYVPMSKDRGNGNLSRIPPNELLGGLEEKRGSPPRL